MPRRYWSYLPEFTSLNRLSTVGSWMIGAGFILTACYLYQALKNGKKALANPWGGLTLEWQTPSPPPHENFNETPTVTAWPYEYLPDATSMPANTTVPVKA
jgi:cytochrome c oxidase subunit I